MLLELAERVVMPAQQETLGVQETPETQVITVLVAQVEVRALRVTLVV